MAKDQGRPRPAGAVYARHRPEQTLFYRIVEEHYPTFRDLLAQQDRPLPTYAAREFDDFLKCGRLEHGFLRVRCDRCQHERSIMFFTSIMLGSVSGAPARSHPPVATTSFFDNSL